MKAIIDKQRAGDEWIDRREYIAPSYDHEHDEVLDTVTYNKHCSTQRPNFTWSAIPIL